MSPQAGSCPARPTAAALVFQLGSGAAPRGRCSYLQDLIHDFLHDLTLRFRIAGAQKQEEIQVTEEDPESRGGVGRGFVLSWLCSAAPQDPRLEVEGPGA